MVDHPWNDPRYPDRPDNVGHARYLHESGYIQPEAYPNAEQYYLGLQQQEQIDRMMQQHQQSGPGPNSVYGTPAQPVGMPQPVGQEWCPGGPGCKVDPLSEGPQHHRSVACYLSQDQLDRCVSDDGDAAYVINRPSVQYYRARESSLPRLVTDGTVAMWTIILGIVGSIVLLVKHHAVFIIPLAIVVIILVCMMQAAGNEGPGGARRGENAQ